MSARKATSIQCQVLAANTGPLPHRSILGEMLSEGTSLVPITPLISPNRISLLALPTSPRSPSRVSWLAPGFGQSDA